MAHFTLDALPLRLLGRGGPLGSAENGPLGRGRQGVSRPSVGKGGS